MNLRSENDQQLKKDLKSAVGEADLVAIATILEVGRSPGAWTWSSFAPTYQTVRLRIEEVLKGRLKSGSEIDAHYMLLEGTSFADPNEPKLNQSIFSVGAKIVVLLNDIEGTRWEEYQDENFAVMSYSERHRVQQAMHDQ
jgi:hypothetical protein